MATQKELFDEKEMREKEYAALKTIDEIVKDHEKVQEKSKQMPFSMHGMNSVSSKKRRQIAGVLLFAIALFILYSLINYKIQEIPELQGQVLALTENQEIKINLGKESGLEEENRLKIFREVRDYNVLEGQPSNEKKLDKYGTLKVTKVTEEYGLAEIDHIDEGMKVSKNDVVKTEGLRIFSLRPFYFKIDILFAKILLFLFGVNSFIIPLFIGTYSVLTFSGKINQEIKKKMFLVICGIIVLTIIIGTVHKPANLFGGHIGKLFTLLLNKLLNTYGTIIFVLAFLVIISLLTIDTGFNLNFLRFFGKGKKEEQEKEFEEDLKEYRQLEIKENYEPEKVEKAPISQEVPEKEEEEEPVKTTQKRITKKEKSRKKKEKSNGNGEEHDYIFPVLSLLEKPPIFDKSKRKDELSKNARLLEAHLSDFGIEGLMIGVNPGPVITQYEFRPEAGIKISKITSLADDLAMRMRAHPVRIIAPIPGKDAVGVEIPNPDPQIVYLRDVLDSREFTTIDSKLTLALGKDISGYPYCTDLADMPHMLIAGATGSGKSVCLNSIICSILFRSTPEDVNFIMIDPKRLELSLYNGIPHLLSPVVLQPNEAIAALSWTVAEMENRYKMLASVGVRHIDSFNELVEKQSQETDDEKSEKKSKSKKNKLEKLPYIVVIVDELADLMMTSAKEIETYLTRLAQMARAVGIHLVLATQRPSVDVITGIIKANFPSRISFQVASKTDSRTILDRNGAEQLLGHGDMLFLPAWSGKPIRVHGSYVSVNEVKQLVRFIKDKNESWQQEDLLSFSEFFDDEPFQAEEIHNKDGLYHKALKIVVDAQTASASLLQRKLRIGYPRAARLLDMLEESGIVGPNQGQKSREVYVDEYYQDNLGNIFGKKSEEEEIEEQ